jgi:diguanylate cyclase (GGDEF)-like protein/PAS domain S-box-containing protein
MSVTEKNRRILVIDDNRAIHEDFRKILGTRGGAAADDAAADDALAELEADLFGEPEVAAPVVVPYLIDAASQGQEGFEMVQRSVERDERYALAFVDMRMPPGWDGVQTIEHLWQADPEIQVVICTAYSDYSWEDIVRKFGMHDRLLILKKPFDTAEVCQLACALTEKWQLARHAHLKLSQLESMVEEQTRDLATANRLLKVEVAERQRSEDRYRLAAVGANDGLWDWDRAKDHLYASPRMLAILGYEDGEVGDSPDSWFALVHEDDRPGFTASMEGYWRDATDHFRREFRMLHKDGSTRWMLCRGMAVRDHLGTKVRAAGSISDITDRKLAEEQLRFDAYHDALTGLANRPLLIERLDAVLARQAHDRGAGFALLFMDLDRFKVINDSLGHVIGDKLLQGIAERLRTAVRCGEGRAQKDLLVRLGGDEFVVLAEGVEREEDALRIAERIHATLAEPFLLDRHEVSARVSIGITMCGPAYAHGEDVMRDADTAMYHAKSEGRARTRFFDAGMHAGAVARWRVETDLRRALERDELTLHFQPVLDPHGRIVSLEALARWNHPADGMVSPAEFIPVAEETGLIVPLGRWALQTACRYAVGWQRDLARAGAGAYDEPLSVTVNVSARQFAEATFVDTVAEALQSSGLAPRSLILEITESTAMSKAEQTLRQLAALRALGVAFYLDDFGTGYSSLSHLHRMPIAALKIDRSFVKAMEEDETSRSIVQAIVALAHALKMKVIAEGVETKGALEILRRMGCDGFQGYYFYRPTPAADIPALLVPQPGLRLASSA